jgi:hypothetical protein
MHRSSWKVFQVWTYLHCCAHTRKAIMPLRAVHSTLTAICEAVAYL